MRFFTPSTALFALLLVPSCASQGDLAERFIEQNFVLIEGVKDVLIGNPEPPDSPCYHETERLRRVTVRRFCMAVHPLTASEFADFLNSRFARTLDRELLWATDEAAPHQIAAIERVGEDYVVRKGAERQPASRVTWLGAMIYCEWITRRYGGRVRFRLPTEAEWEVAARGQHGRSWPWGESAPGAERGYRWKKKKWNYAQPWRSDPVGSSPAGATPEGVMDFLAFPIREWCLNVFIPDASSYDLVRTDCSIANLDSPRSLRGGYTREREFITLKQALFSVLTHQARVWSRFGEHPINETSKSGHGFRIAAEISAIGWSSRKG